VGVYGCTFVALGAIRCTRCNIFSVGWLPSVDDENLIEVEIGDGGSAYDDWQTKIEGLKGCVGVCCECTGTSTDTSINHTDIGRQSSFHFFSLRFSTQYRYSISLSVLLPQISEGC